MPGRKWIDVDLHGLRRILERRGKEFAIYELVQNAWDENARSVHIKLSHPRDGKSELTVLDDSPEGFRNLADAYTLYAESYKKSDPEKRGVFNAGEKFVLALCEEAFVQTTSGTVFFSKEGREETTKRRVTGSEFSGTLRLTIAEWEQMCNAAMRLIPPVKTSFNGQVIPNRKPLIEFETVLSTIIADGRGYLRRSSRKTRVRVFEAFSGEIPTLYEMGIPVVETGDKWHVDVQQKVPVNLDRDNVTPGYLRSLRVAVLNAMADHLTKEDASRTWVREAAGDDRATSDALRRVLDLRFGDRRVTYDPSDQEANMIAVSRGYTVIAPGSLSGDEWKNVKAHELSLPAGQVTPSPKPFSETGGPLKLLEHDDLTPGMLGFEKYSNILADLLLGHPVSVKFANDVGWPFGGCYGSTTLTVNVGSVGKRWFEGSWCQRIYHWTGFLLHEFAHEYVSNHLTEDFHKTCCRLGAKLAQNIIERSDLFKDTMG